METAAKKDMILTSTFEKVYDAWHSGKRRVFIEGGTWASKTYSIMQLLKLILENYREPILCTVTSESMPHLKRGAMRDWLKIMGDELIESCWNRSDFIYTFPKSGCKLEFVSSDQPFKLKGGRREILFCNEINHIDRDSYRQADMRTRLFTICDWNPESEFWYHDEGVGNETGNEYLHVVYQDALEVIPQVQIDNIESYRDKDPNWYRVYALGLPGELAGKVHPEPIQVDKLPDGDVFYGLDYGFASDPTVLIRNVIVGENLYSHEVFSDDSGLTNEDIGRLMTLNKVGYAPIYPDPNEPKSAEELRRLGFNVDETVKGPGSVEYGIKMVNQYYQHWTKESVRSIKAQRNYRYIKKRESTGREYLSKDTTHQWSHWMDARRYAVASHNVYGGELPSPVSNVTGMAVRR